MNLQWIAALLLAATMAGQQGASVPAGSDGYVSRGLRKHSTLFVEPMDGFERYVLPALRKKLVPLTLVEDRQTADLVLSGTSHLQIASGPRAYVWGVPRGDADITIADAHTGQVLWTYSVSKLAGNGNQTTAESIAKHLKAEVEKH